MHRELHDNRIKAHLYKEYLYMNLMKSDFHGCTKTFIICTLCMTFSQVFSKSNCIIV